MIQHPDRAHTVVVAGDVTVDWILAREQAEAANGIWNADHQTRARRHDGGAVLTANLVRTMCEAMIQAGQPCGVVQSIGTADATATPESDHFHHSFSLFTPVVSGDKRPDGKPKLVWRIGQYLGMDRQSGNNKSQEQVPREVEAEPVDVVILDDANLGFRDDPANWPAAIRTASHRPWIVLKMSRPIAKGPLWDHLMRDYADRLIVVMTIDDLRRSDVQISRQLSWERTAQDLYWEFIHNPLVNGISRCAATIVSFDTSGAFVLTPNKPDEPGHHGPWNGDLLFDPEVSESGWEAALPGMVLGNVAVVVAGIVRQLLLNSRSPDIHAGLQASVAAQRRFFREGYGTYEAGAKAVTVGFPFTSVAAELVKDVRPLASVRIQDPVQSLRATTISSNSASNAGSWTILQDQFREMQDVIAEKIVLIGLKAAIHNVPIGRFGEMQIVDRHGIEALSSIQNLLREYCAQPQKRPLSLAVFGPPGSGKSFGVEQIAKSIRPGLIEVKTFNLSQFAHPEELLASLHQVRDIALQGKLPLIFWDEFDTSFQGVPLGWLRYFLAPMQDGTFQQGEITHPIGKCIFAFAGGTSHQMATFGQGLTEDEFKSAKGPDFVSRLKGFLNVLGPNRQTTGAGGDPYYIVRRAILLRSILERSAPYLFHEDGVGRRLSIDSGVLRALLHVSQYKHGVRSIESLISMSSLIGQTTFQRSCLPSEAQMELHVPGLEFLSRVQSIELTGELLEQLAKAAHEIFCAGKSRDGWTFGSKKCATAKTHPLLIDYESLPEQYKESNRATVRNIPRKLARAGYVMIPSRSNEPALEFPGDDLELLSEYEHELWMENRFAAGFRLGMPNSTNSFLNEHLVPWNELDEATRQIDRDNIRGIPTILAKAGFAVVRAQSSRLS